MSQVGSFSRDRVYQDARWPGRTCLERIIRSSRGPNVQRRREKYAGYLRGPLSGGITRNP